MRKPNSTKRRSSKGDCTSSVSVSESETEGTESTANNFNDDEELDDYVSNQWGAQCYMGRAMFIIS